LIILSQRIASCTGGSWSLIDDNSLSFSNSFILWPPSYTCSWSIFTLLSNYFHFSKNSVTNTLSNSVKKKKKKRYLTLSLKADKELKKCKNYCTSGRKCSSIFLFHLEQRNKVYKSLLNKSIKRSLKKSIKRWCESTIFVLWFLFLWLYLILNSRDFINFFVKKMNISIIITLV